MKKVRLLDVLNDINSEMIERAIEADSKEKLQELKMLEKKKESSFIFKYISLFAGSLAVVLIGIFVVNNLNVQNPSLNTNPPIEINDLKKLGKYLGIDLLKYEIKETETIMLYEESEMGEIIYEDGTSLRISKGNEDNSGIYGATLMMEQKYNNINVKIYKFENIKYATWQDDNYSYSYIFSENENVEDVLNKLV